MRGLNPGQQLIQTADGKLHVLSAAPGTLERFLKLYNKRRIIPVSTAAGGRQERRCSHAYVLRFSLISLEGSNPASKQAIAAKVGQKIITKVAAGASPVASGSAASGSGNVVSSGTAATSVTVTSPTTVAQPQPQQIQVQQQQQQVQIQQQQQAAPVVVSSPTVTQQIVNKSPSIVVRNQAGQPIKQIIQKQVVQKVSPLRKEGKNSWLRNGGSNVLAKPFSGRSLFCAVT